jgi:hypothetical protein
MMDIQIKAVTRKEMNARKKEENPLKSSVDYLGVRIKSAVVDGMNSLIQSCSTVRSADILSAGAAQLSKTGMRSEEELHHLQRRLPLICVRRGCAFCSYAPSIQGCKALPEQTEVSIDSYVIMFLLIPKYY